jgi:hypothetical protein
MNMTVFWDVAPCSLAEVFDVLEDRPDDGGSKHLLNVGKFLPDYTAQHPRRQPSSRITLLFTIFQCDFSVNLFIITVLYLMTLSVAQTMYRRMIDD